MEPAFPIVRRWRFVLVTALLQPACPSIAERHSEALDGKGNGLEGKLWSSGFPEDLEDIWTCPLSRTKLERMKLKVYDDFWLETKVGDEEDVYPCPIFAWTIFKEKWKKHLPEFLKALEAPPHADISHHGWIDPGCLATEVNQTDHGGFVYRDGDDLVGAVEICNDERPGKFRYPFEFLPANTNILELPEGLLGGENRMKPVTLIHLKEAGAVGFSWITSDEAEEFGWASDFGGTMEKNGGFLYELEDGRYVFFQFKSKAVTEDDVADGSTALDDEPLTPTPTSEPAQSISIPESSQLTSTPESSQRTSKPEPAISMSKPEANLSMSSSDAMPNKVSVKIHVNLNDTKNKSA